jgi:large subunit ribosomal protein L10
MKTRERKQEDLNALTEQLSNSKSAMIVSFNKLTVNKDQEFRNQLREAGAKYQVVKNTIARLAVKGTPYEGASEHFKGVTGIVWTENDAVVLSKTISKFIKENSDLYTFKAGIVDGKVVNQKQVEAIASLPSKEELLSQLLYVINAQAERLVTVINAVPRDLVSVIKQIGDEKPETAVAEPKAEAKAEEPQAEEVKAEETAPAEAAAEVSEAATETTEAEPAAEEEAAPETAAAETEAPAAEATAAETEQPTEEAAPETEAETPAE